MNWIDWLLLLVVFIGLFTGWRRGFILGILDISAWVFTLFLAFLLYQPVGSWLHNTVNWSEVWTRPFSFVIILFIGIILFSIIAKFLSSRISIEFHHAVVNRLLGLIPGLVNGLVITSLIALVLITISLPPSIDSPVRDSRITNNLAVQIERFAGLFDKVFGEAISQALTFITVPIESDKTIELHFSVLAPEVRSDLETELVTLVNQERTSRGLRPLRINTDLTKVARSHSEDMFARGYFGHVTPDGISPFDRLHLANIDFLAAGENIALAPTLTIAHNGLMNSPGHRANILNTQYGQIGIGIVDGGKYGIMVTQLFKN
jgi:uncharacterized protein YkwD/uncharacterized membrane protein required for colicin V production